MKDDIRIKIEGIDLTKEYDQKVVGHEKEIEALMAAVTRVYCDLCDTLDIDRETGVMSLHAENLIYISLVDLNSIPLSED